MSYQNTTLYKIDDDWKRIEYSSNILLPRWVIMHADVIIQVSPFELIKDVRVNNEEIKLEDAFNENDMGVLQMKLFAQGKTFMDIPLVTFTPLYPHILSDNE